MGDNLQKFPSIDQNLVAQLSEFEYPDPVFIWNETDSETHNSAERTIEDPVDQFHGSFSSNNNKLCVLDSIRRDRQLPNPRYSNLCYANAFLQLFAGSNRIVKHFTSFLSFPCEERFFQNGAYFNLTIALNAMATGDPPDFNLTEFVQWMHLNKTTNEDLFRPGDQNDPSELLLHFLSKAKTEINNERIPHYAFSTPCGERAVGLMKTELYGLLTIYIQSTWKTQCPQCLNTTDPLPYAQTENNILYLDIPNINGHATLQDCIQHHCIQKESTVNGECLICGHNGGLWEKTEDQFVNNPLLGHKLPNHLFIQLHIFKSANMGAKHESIFSRHHNNISFSMNVFLTDNHGKIHEYETTAFICHQGKSNKEAHYLTVQKNSKNAFTVYDDSRMFEIDTNELFDRFRNNKETPFIILLTRINNAAFNRERLTLRGDNPACNAFLTSIVRNNFGMTWKDSCLKVITRLFQANIIRPRTNAIAFKYKMESIECFEAIINNILELNVQARECIFKASIKNYSGINLNQVLLNVVLRQGIIPRKDIFLIFTLPNEQQNHQPLNLDHNLYITKEFLQYHWKLVSLIIAPEEKVFHVYQTFESQWYKFKYTKNEVQKHAELEYHMPDSIDLYKCQLAVLKFKGVSEIYNDNGYDVIQQRSWRTQLHVVPDIEFPLNNDIQNQSVHDEDVDRVPTGTSPTATTKTNSRKSPEKAKINMCTTFDTYHMLEMRDKNGRIINCSLCSNEHLYNCKNPTVTTTILGLVKTPSKANYKRIKTNFIDLEMTKIVEQEPEKLEHFLCTHQANPKYKVLQYTERLWSKDINKVVIKEGEKKKRNVYSFECPNCCIRIFHEKSENSKVSAMIYHYQLFHGESRFYRDISFRSFWPTFDMFCGSNQLTDICPVCNGTIEEIPGFFGSCTVTLLDSTKNTVDQLIHFLLNHHLKPLIYANCIILNNWAKQTQLSSPSTSFTCYICSAAITVEENMTMKELANKHWTQYHMGEYECTFCKEVIQTGDTPHVCNVYEAWLTKLEENEAHVHPLSTFIPTPKKTSLSKFLDTNDKNTETRGMSLSRPVSRSRGKLMSKEKSKSLSESPELPLTNQPKPKRNKSKE